MIKGLKPYEEYKESGLPWLDTVPKHWDMAPNRALMRDQRQVVGARASDYTLLSLTLRGVIARDMVNPKGKFPAQFNTYKVVKPDDFVFCLFDIDETPRGVGLSPIKGMITGAYDIFSPTHRINPRFLYHYYLFVDEGKLMKPLYTGLRKTIQRGVFASLKAPLPPPEEQAAIVRFLDHANRKIDGFIRAKRKLIGLLNEQKQAIIHRAVTRGVHPDVPFKPSGIPWLGDIPKHWETIRCGGLFREVADVGHPNARLLSIDRFKGIIPQDETGRRTRASYDRGAYKRVRPGQLAYNLMNAFMGALGFSKYDGIVSPAYAVAQPLQEIETRYFHYLLRTSSYTGEFNRLSYGIMYERNRLYFERFKVVRALLPPLDEQRAIADWIEANTGALNTAIARTEREIALMQEYRTRLTADLVTGKLDVREAAARLPDPPVDAPSEPAAEEALEETDAEEAGV
jgi:type I restriction enzyme S subunit